VGGTSPILQVGFADANPTTNVSIAVATGPSQISPTGFPVYTGTGTAVLYLQISSTVSATFAQTPQIELADVTGSYSGCIFYGYNNNGSTYSWTPTVPVTGSASFSGGSVTFSPTGLTGGVSVTPTPFYAAIVCQ
jgi:hypothetical protein